MKKEKAQKREENTGVIKVKDLGKVNKKEAQAYYEAESWQFSSCGD